MSSNIEIAWLGRQAVSSADSPSTTPYRYAEGWLHTGDLAVMREDGYFHMTGRLKEMIIRGGENIYPREIEEFLHQHPKIADVYVVGLPDARLSEALLAWVRLKSGESMEEEELRETAGG